MDNISKEQKITASASLITVIIILTIFSFIKGISIRPVTAEELLKRIDNNCYYSGEYSSERHLTRTEGDLVPEFVDITVSENGTLESSKGISHMTGIVESDADTGGYYAQTAIERYRVLDTTNQSITWYGRDITISDNAVMDDNDWYNYTISVSENTSIVSEALNTGDMTGILNTNYLEDISLDNTESDYYIVSGKIKNENFYKELGLALNLEGFRDTVQCNVNKTFYFDKKNKSLIGISYESINLFVLDNSLTVNSFTIDYNIETKDKNKTVELNL